MEKKILIVGAGEGVSMGVARRFGREGYTTLLMGRNRDKLKGLAEKLRAEGISATTQVGDAAQAAQFRSRLEAVMAAEGMPDVVLYNPSIMRGQKPLELSRVQLMEDLQVDVGGAMDLAQVFGPRYIQQEEGTMLFTGGGLALEPFMDYTSLSIGKAALRNYVLTLAQAMQSHAVRVGMVTIAGMVQWGTHFDPEKIAEKFWQLHTGQVNGPEVIYK